MCRSGVPAGFLPKHETHRWHLSRLAYIGWRRSALCLIHINNWRRSIFRCSKRSARRRIISTADLASGKHCGVKFWWRRSWSRSRSPLIEQFPSTLKLHCGCDIDLSYTQPMAIDNCHKHKRFQLPNLVLMKGTFWIRHRAHMPFFYIRRREREIPRVEAVDKRTDVTIWRLPNNSNGEFGTLI